MARKILLADDSVTAQNMGRKILVDAGYDVLTVNNGSAALKRITETKPDLIILDVYMPGYSGLEVCQRLKDAPETAHIPVLLSVGKLEPFKPQEARRVKANAHIVKPFEASELLSAIARLEDGMVPQAHKPSFCSPLPNSEAFSEDSSPSWETKTDSVRKGRGSRKKEKEAEDAVANFRDFRKGKEKAEEAEATAAAEMPRDITKEELDALSAVAAKLDGSVASVSGDAAQAEGSLEESAPVSPRTPGTNLRRRASDRAEDERTAAVNTPAADVPVAETTAPVELPVVALDAVGSPVVRNETDIQQVEVPKEVAATEERVEAAQAELHAVSLIAESQSSESTTEEPASVESPAAEIQASKEVTAQAANTGLLAEEPAPIDRQDEPIFAVAIAEDKVEAPTIEAEQSTAPTETEVGKEEAAEEKFEPTEIKSVDAVVVEEAKAPVVAASAETVEAEAPAPSDEELAEALRLLTPATAYAEATVSSVQMDGAGCEAPAGSRWMAEAVGLTPEEVAMSLEAEMFRTFGTVPAGESDSMPVAGKISATITEAVENRLAEVAGQSESSFEEAPKAMAAAAAAEVSTPAEKATPGSEEGSIASIVDKVLADLRPKIVEEIAKKLGQSH